MIRRGKVNPNNRQADRVLTPYKPANPNSAAGVGDVGVWRNRMLKEMSVTPRDPSTLREKANALPFGWKAVNVPYATAYRGMDDKQMPSQGGGGFMR